MINFRNNGTRAAAVACGLAIAVAAPLGASARQASRLAPARRAEAPRPAQAVGSFEQRLGASSKVSVTNPSGRVAVRGVAGDMLRVRARDDSDEPVRLEVDSGGGATVSIRPIGGSDVQLEVELPRNVSYVSVEAGSGDASVTAIDGEVRVHSASGNAQVSETGKATVIAGSGAASVEGVAGAAYVEAASGDVTARRVSGDLFVKSGSGSVTGSAVGGALEVSAASGDISFEDVAGAVRAVTISGNVQLSGVKGPVDASTASGDVVLAGSAANVDAKTASGSVVYTGQLAPEASYNLKSMSGDVVMRLCGQIAGFTVTLASYTGEIETAFPLTIDRPVGPITKRFKGRYGDGRAQIQLEAFSGNVQLLACDADTPKQK